LQKHGVGRAGDRRRFGGLARYKSGLVLDRIQRRIVAEGGHREELPMLERLEAARAAIPLAGVWPPA
jgi:hypothetical protein